jgi:hypothetical protein
MANLSLCAKRYSALQEVSLLVNNISRQFYESVFHIHLKYILTIVYCSKLLPVLWTLFIVLVFSNTTTRFQNM